MTAPAAPTIGYAAKMGVAIEVTPGTAAVPTVAIEFLSETLTAKYEHVIPEGIRGHRGYDSENVAIGKIDPSGTITLPMKKTNLSTFLPWILGGTTALNVTPLAEALPYFTVMIDRGAKVFTYSGCKVNKATFRTSAEGEPYGVVELEIIAMKVSIGAAGSFTAGLTLDTEQPFQHFQGVFTFAAAARNVHGSVITVDNGLLPDQYRNSQTRQLIPEGTRNVTNEVDTPYTSDEVDLLTLELDAGVGGTVVYTNGTDVLTFTFACLQVPQQDPSVQSRSAPINLRTAFVARRLAGADELQVTLT